MFVIFSFSYSGNGPLEVSFRRLYTMTGVIKGATTRVKFEVHDIEIENKKADKDVFFKVDDIDTANESYIRAVNLKIINVSAGSLVNDKIYFRDANDKDSPIDTIKFSLSGELIFNWDKGNKKEQISIGYRGEGESDNTKNYISLILDDTLATINLLNIKVVDNLDLGKAIAGSTLDTSKGSGTPAKIEATGEYNKNVKFKISDPDNIYIENSSKEKLKVNVWFKDGRGTEVKKVLNSPTNEKHIGKVSDVIIDGSCTSQSTSRGKYTGRFTVRVEYDD